MQKLSLSGPPFTLLMLLTCVTLTGNSQTAREAQSESYFQLGMQVFDYNHRSQAVDLFNLAIEANPRNAKAYLMAGRSLLMTSDKAKALPYLIKAEQLDPSVDYNLLYYEGEAYRHALMFDSAVRAFSRYAELEKTRPHDATMADEAARKIAACHYAKQCMATPSRVSLTNPGSAINSEYADYAPAINADETLLAFTSRRADGNKNPNVAADYEYYEDIFVSKRVNGGWTSAKNIGSPINTAQHDSNLSLSSDGKMLFLYKDSGGGDIYVSTLQDSGNWSEPAPMEDVNSPHRESAVISSEDAQTLYFASDRPGGYGGTDIYRAIRKGPNTWGDIRNLGKPVNTEGDESGLFLSTDGSLYFSSNGHPGMGGHDIYRSRYDSLHGSWGTPVNMGFPINTVEDDRYFVLTRSGSFGYIATLREGGSGGLDLYRVDMHEWTAGPQPEGIEQPEADTLEDATILVINMPHHSNDVSGITKTIKINLPADTGEEHVSGRSRVFEVDVPPYELLADRSSPFVVNIEGTSLVQPVTSASPLPDDFSETYIELLVLDKVTHNPVTGQVSLRPPGGILRPFIRHAGGGYSLRFRTDSLRFCGIRITGAGYDDFTDLQFFRSVSENSLMFTDTLWMAPDMMAFSVPDQVIVHYRPNQDTPDSFTAVDKALFEMLADYSLGVRIAGYSDNTGSAPYNLALSRRRAEIVRSYLRKNGIDDSRIAVEAYGEERPVAGNDTEDSRSRNRRVELVFTR